MSDIKGKCRLQPDLLQYRCAKDLVADEPFDSIAPCCDIIGQDRALEAMDLGLQIEAKGYNIFVTGQPGSGRLTAVKTLLESVTAETKRPLTDICFVNNFKMAENPTVLYFPAGQGRMFKKAVAYLIDSLVTVIPKIFSGETYREARGRVIKEFENRQRDLFKDFEKKIKEKGFVLVQVQIGPALRPDLQPVVNGEPHSLAELEKTVEEGQFSAAELERLRGEYEILFKDLQQTSEQSHRIAKDLEDELNRLDTSNVLPLVNDKIETLKRKYPDPKVQQYLTDLNEVLIDLLDFFRGGEQGHPADPSRLRDMFSLFTVNLLVDNDGRTKPPIVIEDFPSYKNLFGSIEKVHDPATGWQSDFTRIRGGSFLRANGGYLVVQAADIFQEPYVWPTLKRALRTGRLTITNVDVMTMPGGGLKPETLDLKVKVVLIGESRIYDILYHLDEEFKKVFKVKAEFDSVMHNDRQAASHYSRFVKKVVDDDKLLPFDHSGLSAVTEQGVKLSGRRDRLSTRFGYIADLVTESAWLARKNGKSVVDRNTVKQAIQMQRKRVDLVETKIQEMYERDLYLIDVAGWKVGQINGLSVYDLGELAFGRPSRITASVSPGADGVINIEREASLSGRTFDKGVLILTGFMRHRFGARRPLVFSASLCFEQSYGGIDGDSASSTEIYALLSALSDQPINQALAVTGSVNQKGEIQPIGGVNEKIEGYFDVCLIHGLTGEQGVLIPVQNQSDLMLKDEVVAAAAAGTFHIYAVSTIDEGIEILTGKPAGTRGNDGSYPEGSINRLVEDRLAELAEIWRRYMTPWNGR
jgi:ATP-dependent Lon protease